MEKKTKIVATLGPATENKKTLKQLVNQGVNVFRFNLKHNSYEWHSNLIKSCRQVAEELDVHVSLLADLQGPELRTAVFEDGTEKIDLIENTEVFLCDGKESGKTCIPFKDIALIDGLEPGHTIYIDDGKFELRVVKITSKHIKADVITGGKLGMRKSMSIPQANINVPTLTAKDRKDLEFAVKEKMDFVALSFVRDAKDIKNTKNRIKKLGGNQDLVAKIETLKAIENLEEIIDETDSVMVARGDLGVEVPIERVPKIQKRMIKMCREQSKPVIVATQMLHSMVDNPYPSRAEVADIANSVFDMSDALMLSEETAMGNHPVLAVKTMAKIARYNEVNDFENSLKFNPQTFQEVIISSSIRSGRVAPENEQSVKGYVVFTESGHSARALSRFRPNIPIYAFSQHEETVKKLPLSYGVDAFCIKLSKEPTTNIEKAVETLLKKRLIEKKDKLIIIFGNNVGVEAENNTLTIYTV